MNEVDSVERSNSLDQRLVTLPASEIVRWKVVIAALVSVVVLIIGGGAWDRLDARSQRQDIIECTSPGSHKPTAADPTTGHKCFDEASARGVIVIRQILDTDANGCVDVIEVRDLLTGVVTCTPTTG